MPKHFRIYIPCYHEINISSKGTLDHDSAKPETSSSRSLDLEQDIRVLILPEQNRPGLLSDTTVPRIAVHPSRISSMIACIRRNALPISGAGNREHQLTLDRVMLDVSVMMRFGTLRYCVCVSSDLKSNLISQDKNPRKSWKISIVSQHLKDSRFLNDLTLVSIACLIRRKMMIKDISRYIFISRSNNIRIVRFSMLTFANESE